MVPVPARLDKRLTHVQTYEAENQVMLKGTPNAKQFELYNEVKVNKNV